MKVTQEKLEHSQVGLQVEIPADRVKSSYERTIGDLMKNANIPGFRKGKVPRQIILQRFGGEQIKSLAIENLLDSTMPEAVKVSEVEAIGNFQIRSSFEEMLAQYQSDQSFTYQASVDVPPEISLGDYKKLAVTAEENLVAEDAVAQFLAERQRENSTLIPVSDRPAQMDDVAVVDYSGKLADGSEITGAQAQDAELEMSADRFLADLVDGMVGMTIGQTKEIPVTFPEGYPREDLAGQAATFTVTLHDLKTPELPALDDDFAQEISDKSTLAELEADLAERFAKQAEDRTKNNIEQAITKALGGIVVVDLPETLIDRESGQILQMMASQFSQYGMDVNKLFTRETIPKMKENCREDAVRNLAQDLAIKEVARQENIEIPKADIEARALTVRQQLQGEAIDEDRLREFVTEDLTKEKVLEFLRAQATITMVPEGSLEQEQPATEAEA